MTDQNGDILASLAPRSADRLARLLLGPLAVTLALILVVFYVIFVPLRVDGFSMLPTLFDQDLLLATKGYPQPTRGDIVAVHTTVDGADNEIIKRVIGLPGDTVEIRSDVAFVNGTEEPKRGQVIVPAAAVSAPPQVIAEGMLYVMGDNRAVSEDSRIIGPVPTSDVVGRAVAVFGPVTRVRMVH